MSIAGYVLKAARAARDGLSGRAVGPDDIIVGDRLQAEGERVRVSPGIKPMKNWSKLGQFPSLIKPRKRSRPPLWCLTMLRSGPPVEALVSIIRRNPAADLLQMQRPLLSTQIKVAAGDHWMEAFRPDR
jgi:hypothetical protein